MWSPLQEQQQHLSFKVRSKASLSDQLSQESVCVCENELAIMNLQLVLLMSLPQSVHIFAVFIAVYIVVDK